MRHRLLLAILAFFLPALAIAQATPNTDSDRMGWWREARFGLFVHWGLYATLEGEWNGHTDFGEWIRHSAHIPRAEYDTFVRRFTAEKFDADRWAELAANAGMRYVVITTKHHDGFCLWKSEVTDFDVDATPFGKDVMAEIARAFRAKGLKVCWYHSIMDWHHDDYLPRRDWETDRGTEGASFARYVDYLHAQVTELLTNYGPIGVMWFDGEWEATWNHELGQPLYDLCRRLQPDVIVNNRVDRGRGGMAGMTVDAGFAGDFGTPEQEVPATGFPGVDWESCMTMNRHWGWNRADTVWKSPRVLIRTLVDIASKGGNFLLNIGPKADGTFPDLAVERLKAIGAWMAINHEAVHGTTASPIGAPAWGRITTRSDGHHSTFYLCVFDPPADGVLHINAIGNAPRSAHVLGSAVGLKTERSEDGIDVHLPESARGETDCLVVALEVVGAPIPYYAPRIEAISDVFLRSTTVTLHAASGEIAVRYTADDSEPTFASPEYRDPIVLTADTMIRARGFHRGLPAGPSAARRFLRIPPRPAVTVEGTVPGLWCETFAGTWDRLPDFDELVAEAREPVDDIALAPGTARESVAHRYTGWFEVPTDGVYDIALTSDDGSRIWVDDILFVDNDGLHGAETLVATTSLAKGLHPIRVDYFNKTGGAELAVRVGSPGQLPQPIPRAAYRRTQD